ncbi:MAG: glucosaminidase domain-containing protein [Rhizobiaceae bacterium]|nr:glucosaminidase domain-containing protein [Rhizobiaceae bacterium]
MNLSDAFQLALKIGTEKGADRAAVHYAISVSTLETDNGNWPGVPAGKGSNNMGAIIKYAPDQSFFTSGDTHANGEKFQSKFRTYPNEEEGYRDFWKQLMRPNVLAAATENSGTKAVALQYANGYFEAAPAVYGQRLADTYARILNELGEPRLLNFARVGMLKKKTEEQPPFQLAYSHPRPSLASSSGAPSGSGGAKS